MRSAKIPPNGRSSERPAAPVALKMRAGEQRAALGHLRRLEFVAQTLLERRRLTGSGVSVQVSQIAMERVRHLVDRRRGLGADKLNERIFRRSPARARHAGLAVVHEGVEHALQCAERSGRYPAHENLAERQSVEARRVERLARTLSRKLSSMLCER
jgi:hypothetical protein